MEITMRGCLRPLHSCTPVAARLHVLSLVFQRQAKLRTGMFEDTLGVSTAMPGAAGLSREKLQTCQPLPERGISAGTALGVVPAETGR